MIQTPTVDIKPVYMLPIGTSWEHQASTTLIGDATHLMCPWTDVGLNLAMLDSLLLARIITKAHEAAGQDDAVSFQSALSPLMKEFKVGLVARAKKKAKEMFSQTQVVFGENMANGFAEVLEDLSYLILSFADPIASEPIH